MPVPPVRSRSSLAGACGYSLGFEMYVSTPPSFLVSPDPVFPEAGRRGGQD